MPLFIEALILEVFIFMFLDEFYLQNIDKPKKNSSLFFLFFHHFQVENQTDLNDIYVFATPKSPKRRDTCFSKSSRIKLLAINKESHFQSNVSLYFWRQGLIFILAPVVSLNFTTFEHIFLKPK